jgi:uncharacterized protein (DUF302 family)
VSLNVFSVLTNTRVLTRCSGIPPAQSQGFSPLKSFIKGTTYIIILYIWYLLTITRNHLYFTLNHLHSYASNHEKLKEKAMKKVFSLLFILFVATFLSAQDSPFIESRSKLSFDETIETIKNTAEKDGWKVLIVHNLQESLRKNGQDVLPVSVIEVCKPEYSGIILKNDDHRGLSVFMPCRISVYEKGNGEVFISRLSTGTFESTSIDKKAAEVMNEASNGVEKILDDILMF